MRNNHSFTENDESSNFNGLKIRSLKPIKQQPVENKDDYIILPSYKLLKSRSESPETFWTDALIRYWSETGMINLNLIETDNSANSISTPNETLNSPHYSLDSKNATLNSDVRKNGRERPIRILKKSTKPKSGDSIF